MKAVIAQDFISLGDELIKDKSSPIKVRASTSRAYYGAYHAAESFHDSLPSKGITSVHGGIHEQLIQCLVNPTLPSTDPRYIISKSIGYMLTRVRKYRVIADYNINFDAPFEEAATALAEAKKIISKL